MGSTAEIPSKTSRGERNAGVCLQRLERLAEALMSMDVRIVSRVLSSGLAAGFSAFGLGFSDIAHQYEAALASKDAAGLKTALDDVPQKARRGMYGEGIDFDECRVEITLHVSSGKDERQLSLEDGRLPANLPADARLSVSVLAAESIAQPRSFPMTSMSFSSEGSPVLRSRAGVSDRPTFPGSPAANRATQSEFRRV